LLLNSCSKLLVKFFWYLFLEFYGANSAYKYPSMGIVNNIPIKRLLNFQSKCISSTIIIRQFQLKKFTNTICNSSISFLLTNTIFERHFPGSAKQYLPYFAWSTEQYIDYVNLPTIYLITINTISLAYFYGARINYKLHLYNITPLSNYGLYQLLSPRLLPKVEYNYLLPISEH